jgi:hypothetical protein
MKDESVPGNLLKPISLLSLKATVEKEKEAMYQHGLKYLPVKRLGILNMAIVLVKALLR